MSLKYKIKTLDGLDDAVKELYKQDGDSFILNVVGVASDEELLALKAQNKQLKDDATSSAADAEAAAQEKLKAEGKHEEYAASLLRENESLKAVAAQEKADRLAVDLNSTAESFGAKAGVDANAAKMLTMAFKANLAHDENGVLKGLNGETPEELYSAFEKSGEYNLLWKGSGANGGGEQGGSESGGKSLSDMTPLEQVKLANTNPAEYAKLIG